MHVNNLERNITNSGVSLMFSKGFTILVHSHHYKQAVVFTEKVEAGSTNLSSGTSPQQGS